MPDAPGLELIRQELNKAHPDAVLETSFDHAQAALLADPQKVLEVLGWLRDTPGQEYRFLSSLHCADYLPAEPRFGIHYELLNMPRVERLRVKAMLPGPASENGAANGTPGRAEAGASEPDLDDSGGERAEAEHLPVIPSCVELFPTAEFQEREVYDFFGIVFRGHPDLRRILLPEDYVGWPLRRDYPVGGEPVLFTHNEPDSPGWYE
jgi:NADH-quinone oxidoreductase subunit C